jgi:hypothetical protein
MRLFKKIEKNQFLVIFCQISATFYEVKITFLKKLVEEGGAITYFYSTFF